MARQRWVGDSENGLASRRTLVADRLGILPCFRKAGQENGYTVREFTHERQVPAHHLAGLAQSGEQNIAALLNA